jgi:hypothetical protein
MWGKSNYPLFLYGFVFILLAKMDFCFVLEGTIDHICIKLLTFNFGGQVNEFIEPTISNLIY